MRKTCVPPPSSLVSWWPGDGHAEDIGDSNDGSLQGGATFAPGVVGQAFTFDGVSGAAYFFARTSTSAHAS